MYVCVCVCDHVMYICVQCMFVVCMFVVVHVCEIMYVYVCLCLRTLCVCTCVWERHM